MDVLEWQGSRTASVCFATTSRLTLSPVFLRPAPRSRNHFSLPYMRSNLTDLAMARNFISHLICIRTWNEPEQRDDSRPGTFNCYKRFLLAVPYGITYLTDKKNYVMRSPPKMCSVPKFMRATAAAVVVVVLLLLLYGQDNRRWREGYPINKI